jgi:hypothetical protein
LPDTFRSIAATHAHNALHVRRPMPEPFAMCLAAP